MSDYGHHPSELIPTFEAIHTAYPDRKLLVLFQPHQAARTRALLAEFAESFGSVDELIISDIYLSRDTPEDIAYMSVERLIEAIIPHQKSVRNGHGLAHTSELIKSIDREHPGEYVFLIQGAGSIDEIRYSFEYLVA